ncbi:MAG: MBL fold metallo-hydrolase [Ignavibacteriaceae bacterium]
MITIKKFIFNPFSENTYVIWDEETHEGIVVDPGCIDSFEEKELSDFIEEKGIEPKYLVITHCHIDHVLGIKFIKEKYNPIYLVPELDKSLLEFSDKQAAAFGIEFDNPPMPDQYIDEYKKIYLGTSEITFLFTPGHSPGEHCLYFEKEKFCIAGDVLFHGGIGRTDLWGGDYDTLLKSIREKLFILPDDTVIYPGHGENTRIGIEKRENPFVKM